MAKRADEHAAKKQEEADRAQRHCEDIRLAAEHACTLLDSKHRQATDAENFANDKQREADEALAKWHRLKHEVSELQDIQADQKRKADKAAMETAALAKDVAHAKAEAVRARAAFKSLGGKDFKDFIDDDI